MKTTKIHLSNIEGGEGCTKKIIKGHGKSGDSLKLTVVKHHPKTSAPVQPKKDEKSKSRGHRHHSGCGCRHKPQPVECPVVFLEDVTMEKNLDVAGDLATAGNSSVGGDFDVAGKTTLRDTEITGDLCVKAEPQVIVDTVENPFLTLALGNVVEPIVNNGLTYTASDEYWRVTDITHEVGSISQGSLSDPVGTRVFFCGLPEIFASPDRNANTRPLFDEETSILTITADPELPVGQVYTISLKVRYSTEPNYDFLIVRDASGTVYRRSGFNNDNADPYSIVDYSFDIPPGQTVTVTFSKDEAWYSGIDTIYFYIDQIVQNYPRTGGNLCVQSDLTVDGTIINLIGDLTSQLPLPISDEIYNMHQKPEFSNTGFVMYTVVDASYDVSQRLQDPAYPIFGYNQDGTLNKTAGKIYNDEFKKFDLRIHGPAPQQEIYYHVPEIKEAQGNLLNYYTQRGFGVPYKDTIPELANGYFWTTSGQDIIFMQFTVNAANEPIFLDLAAYTNAISITGITHYKADIDIPNLGDNRSRRYGYPMRIAVTQSVNEYKSLLGTKATAYYNITTRQLFVDVPKGTNFISYYYADYNWAIAFAPYRLPLQISMDSFNGVFLPISRSLNNELIPNNFATAEAIVQISDTVNFTTITDYFGGEIIESEFSKDRTVNSTYDGVVAALYNGGNPSYDIYLVQPNILNAFVTPLNPYIQFATGEYGPGDNPNTFIKEYFSTNNKIHDFDTEVWAAFPPQFFDDNFIDNIPIPEQINTVPAPVNGDSKISIQFVNGHEFMHSIQSATGVVRIIDQEASAVGSELRPKMTNNYFWPVRAGSFAQYQALVVRGRIALGQDFSYVSGADYGGGIWYNDLYQKYDPNQQITRRAFDILSNYYNGLLDTGKWAGTFAEQLIGGATYQGAYRLSTKQAMTELIGKDLQDYFSEYAISAALLRNNSSIPAANRAKFPHWLYSSNYTYVDQLSITNSAYRRYWDEINSNAPGGPAITAINSLVPEGDPPILTFFPILNLGDDLAQGVQDLTMLIFVVDSAVNSITVTIDRGLWDVTLLQYNEGTNSGEYNYTTTRVNVGETLPLTVSSVKTGTGLVKLVLAHISITDFTNYNPSVPNPIYNLSPYTEAGQAINRTTGIVSVSTA